MTLVHYPVELGAISEASVEAFAKLCEELERPLLLFSRTGARATKLWEAAESISFGS